MAGLSKMLRAAVHGQGGAQLANGVATASLGPQGRPSKAAPAFAPTAPTESRLAAAQPGADAHVTVNMPSVQVRTAASLHCSTLTLGACS